jgi:predicted aspartyl protease
MVDTGAQYSVLNKPTELLSQRISLVQGATGSKAYQWTSKCQVDLGQHQVTHSFLVIPECPAPLLGRDLLTKVRAHIHFELDGIKVTDGQGQPLQVLTMSLEDEHHLFSLRGPPPKPIGFKPTPRLGQK